MNIEEIAKKKIPEAKTLEEFGKLSLSYKKIIYKNEVYDKRYNGDYVERYDSLTVSKYNRCIMIYKINSTLAAVDFFYGDQYEYVPINAAAILCNSDIKPSKDELIRALLKFIKVNDNKYMLSKILDLLPKQGYDYPELETIKKAVE